MVRERVEKKEAKKGKTMGVSTAIQSAFLMEGQRAFLMADEMAATKGVRRVARTAETGAVS